MSSALKLYELSAQFKELENIGDSDEIPPEVLRDTLEGILGTFDEKCIQIAKFVLSLEANAAAVDEAAKAMKIRATRIAARAQSVKAYLLFHMQTVGKSRIDSSELVIARRNNPVAVQVSDATSIPAEFWNQPPPPPPQLDKKAVKAALQAGASVLGAYLESGERIEIKL